MKTIVLIPSLNPDTATVGLIRRMIDKGMERIIVVNDGSEEACQSIFDEIAAFPQCTVLTHIVNQGKGRALKTGIDYILRTFSRDEIVGIVTADADGQHSPEDVGKVAAQLSRQPESLVLGTRDFGAGNVPFKSRNGNRITTAVFAFLYGKKVQDTQTGLRGIPYSYLKTCLRLTGERFEYEINMLISAVRDGLPICEVPIQTIYFNNNRETHFNTVLDSARIYAVMLKCFLRFSASGILSFLLDIGLFALLTKTVFSKWDIELSVLFGTVLARACSSLFNYFVNKRLVFQSAARTAPTMLRYYILCAAQALASWGLVTGVYTLFSAAAPDTTFIKVFVDLVLFFASFQLQRRWVYKEEGRRSC